MVWEVQHLVAKQMMQMANIFPLHHHLQLLQQMFMARKPQILSPRLTHLCLKTAKMEKLAMRGQKIQAAFQSLAMTPSVGMEQPLQLMQAAMVLSAIHIKLQTQLNLHILQIKFWVVKPMQINTLY